VQLQPFVGFQCYGYCSFQDALGNSGIVGASGSCSFAMNTAMDGENFDFALKFGQNGGSYLPSYADESAPAALSPAMQAGTQPRGMDDR